MPPIGQGPWRYCQGLLFLALNFQLILVRNATLILDPRQWDSDKFIAVAFDLHHFFLCQPQPGLLVNPLRDHTPNREFPHRGFKSRTNSASGTL